MNRVTKLVAVIAVGLLIPSVMHAKTVGLDQSNALSQLQKAFQLPDSTDPRRPDVDAMLKQLRKQLEERGVLDKKEQTWLDKVQKARVDLDKAKAAESLPTLAAVAIDQERARKNEELEALFPQVQAQSSGINMAELQSNEKSCPADFSQFNAMGSLLASDAVKQMQSDPGGFLEQAQKDKVGSVANLAKLADAEKRKIREKFEKENEGFAEQQESSNFKESFAAQAVAQKERIDGLKTKEKELLDEKLKRQLSMVDFVFKELIPKLIEDAKNINKVRGVGNMVASRLQQARQHSFNAAMAGANKLSTICEENVAAMQQGDSDIGAGEPLLATAMNVAYAKNDEYFFTNFQDRAIRAVSGLECRNSAAELETAIGESSTLKQRIDLLPQATDAGTLLRNVMNFLPEVTTALGSTMSPLKNAIEDCIASSKTMKSMQQFIARTQSGGGPQVAGGQRRGGSQRGSPQPNQLATGKQHFGSAPVQ